MTAATTLRSIYLNWAKNFGCKVSALFAPGISVVPHAALGDWQGAFFLRHRTTCLISVPRSSILKAQALTAGRSAAEAFDQDFVRYLFPGGVLQTVGPAWLGYADATDIRPLADAQGRRLDESDVPALERLAKACDRREWELSSVRVERQWIFGRFVGAELVAAGSLEDVHDSILNVGIITHPGHRGRGYAKEVVSAMTQFALEQPAVLQYRTLLTNLPSIAIARRLGFQEQAQTLAVRLA